MSSHSHDSTAADSLPLVHQITHITHLEDVGEFSNVEISDDMDAEAEAYVNMDLALKYNPDASSAAQLSTGERLRQLQQNIESISMEVVTPSTLKEYERWGLNLTLNCTHA